jgi:hypothetical protein
MRRSARMRICALIVALSFVVLSHPTAVAAPIRARSLSSSPVVWTAPLAGPSEPVIDVWYTHTQRFGHIGNSQRWVNILGNVSDPDGIASLAYSLNGGSSLGLNIGPDGARLAEEGDFNVEIDYSDLSSGSNEVVIVATDNLDNVAVATVTVEYESGNVWPKPYVVQWNVAEQLLDVVQVVDGLWAVEDGLLRPVEASSQSYDRLVALGDISWLDYEVSVPIIIHQFFAGAPGAGILVRWNGHGDDSNQPHYAHPFGALGWYRVVDGTARLRILGNDHYEIATDYSGRQLELDVPYIFKMRAETKAGPRSFYRFKVWEAGDPEPSSWDLAGYGYDIDEDELHGSVVLVAHRADASFGDVTVTPPLTLSMVGGGTVTAQPPSALQHYGDDVTLTATPDIGWCFSGWTGDLSGSENPETITLEDGKSVTGIFSQSGYTLLVNVVGAGAVTVEPDEALYDCGEAVSLTALPDAGWSFSGWSGDLQTAENPALLTMSGHKTVTSTFVTHRFYLPLVARSHPSG